MSPAMATTIFRTFSACSCSRLLNSILSSLVNPSTILSAYKDGDVVPAAAELYRKILATPFDDPAIDDLLLQAQQMILDDAIVYTGLGAPVSLVLPDNLTGVISNGFGDVEWRKASFA